MVREDVPVLRELIYSEREVWAQYSGYGDKSELLARAYMQHTHQTPDAEFGFLAAVLKQTGRPIGQVHLEPYVNRWYRVPNDPVQPVYDIEAELAFAFGKEYWGQGLAYEACRSLIDYAFNVLKLPRLVGGANENNDRSVRLQKRLGFEIFRNQDPDNSARPSWVSVLVNPIAA
jgi:RimJ/RimL family protein N-acetyltransferase